MKQCSASEEDAVMDEDLVMDECRRIVGLSSIWQCFDLFLIDQFGVLHDGVRPYDGAVDCLKQLKSSGKSVMLLSNSGKRASANAARLEEFGFPQGSFDGVMTSGEVAWQGILDHSFGAPFVSGRRMYLLGHEDYDYGFDQIGMALVDDPAASDFILIAASRAPKMSLDHYRVALAAAAKAKIPALCCNPDRLMLTGEGLQPSAGEVASLYRELGGDVTFVGKPYPAIYAAAMKQNPQVARGATLAIGDSIEHDIGGGHRAGLSTALVRTGLSSNPDDHPLREEMRRYAAVPDFVLPSLRW
jgi:HAD superfamily hydrolase (TIGR01459 family)